MSSGLEARALLARYLRQRREMGEAEFVFETLDAAQLGALLEPRPRGAARTASGLPTASAAMAAASSRTVEIGSLAALRDEAYGCHACGLAGSRNSVVFGEGSPNAELLVVGEAPGADEDASGRPFVGRAGRLLTLMLAAVGFRREEVYICNVLKCRPPGNRNPQESEVAACSGYLRRQVELVGPRVVIACGTFAAQTLLQSTLPIGRLRGSAHQYGGVPLIATYHPAALLRNPAWVRPAWEDLQRVRAVLASR
jgi:uracil-DNA glycosylase